MGYNSHNVWTKKPRDYLQINWVKGQNVTVNRSNFNVFFFFFIWAFFKTVYWIKWIVGSNSERSSDYGIIYRTLHGKPFSVNYPLLTVLAMYRSVRVVERLALPTSDHGVAGSNPAGGEILPKPKRRFIAQSLSCSPFHRLEMTEILFKGRKTLTHPSIHGHVQ